MRLRRMVRASVPASAWRSRLRRATGRMADAFWRGLRVVVWCTGVFGLLMLVLAFTTVPYRAHRWLGLAGGELRSAPDGILVLGGTGMPSGSELIRLHTAATLAIENPQVEVFVVHVADTAVLDAMRTELELRGVGRERIVLVGGGGNTREQALSVAERSGTRRGEQWALVTAPENMYRTLGTFRKAGLTRVQGVPAFDRPLFLDLDYDHGRLGGKALVPDVSGSLSVRYDLWHHLRLEVLCLREYMAIAYYKLNGWM